MPETLLAVGTKKGLFLGRSSDRAQWLWEGPHHPMQAVASIGIDTRQDPVRVMMGGRSEHWGPLVVSSDDLGRTWREDEQAALAFPADAGASVAQIWQIQPGPRDRPGEVWAGVEPAAVFKSTDGGNSFSLERGLWDHPHRPEWQPGAGGQCMHTVLPHPTDPQRTLVAMSTGGVYRTFDGGQSWEAANAGISAYFLPDPAAEFGQCVHKVAQLSGDPDRLMLQHHGGVYASDDWGGKWQPAQSGLPADFGFGMVAHPRRDQTAYCFPLHSDMRRLPIDGRAQIFRTDDASSWHSSSTGLPTSNFQSIVLRDALTVDDADPLGVYFGTRSGGVWASADEGATWQQIAHDLPDVLCVRAAAVA